MQTKNATEFVEKSDKLTEAVKQRFEELHKLKSLVEILTELESEYQYTNTTNLQQLIDELKKLHTRTTQEMRRTGTFSLKMRSQLIPLVDDAFDTDHVEAAIFLMNSMESEAKARQRSAKNMVEKISEIIALVLSLMNSVRTRRDSAKLEKDELKHLVPKQTVPPVTDNGTVTSIFETIKTLYSTVIRDSKNEEKAELQKKMLLVNKLATVYRDVGESLNIIFKSLVNDHQFWEVGVAVLEDIKLELKEKLDILKSEQVPLKAKAVFFEYKQLEILVSSLFALEKGTENKFDD